MQTTNLKYLVIEYAPHMMDGDKLIPARIDGHYGPKEWAQEVAEMWAENPLHPETRIAVVEVVHVTKDPKHWAEDNAA